MQELFSLCISKKIKWAGIVSKMKVFLKSIKND